MLYECTCGSKMLATCQKPGRMFAPLQPSRPSCNFGLARVILRIARPAGFGARRPVCQQRPSGLVRSSLPKARLVAHFPGGSHGSELEGTRLSRPLQTLSAALNKAPLVQVGPVSPDPAQLGEAQALYSLRDPAGPALLVGLRSLLEKARCVCRTFGQNCLGVVIGFVFPMVKSFLIGALSKVIQPRIAHLHPHYWLGGVFCWLFLFKRQERGSTF